MSDLNILLDKHEYAKRALATIDVEEFELMNETEKVSKLSDIYDSRNKVLNYLGYDRIKDEKGIWTITKVTPPEQKELDYYDKWLDEQYDDMVD